MSIKYSKQAKEIAEIIISSIKEKRGDFLDMFGNIEFQYCLFCELSKRLSIKDTKQFNTDYLLDFPKIDNKIDNETRALLSYLAKDKKRYPDNQTLIDDLQSHFNIHLDNEKLKRRSRSEIIQTAISKLEKFPEDTRSKIIHAFLSYKENLHVDEKLVDLFKILAKDELHKNNN